MMGNTHTLSMSVDDNQRLIDQLKTIVGNRQVLTSVNDTERFRKGFRSGEGDAVAVVKPATLLQLWKVLQACVDGYFIVPSTIGNCHHAGCQHRADRGVDAERAL